MFFIQLSFFFFFLIFVCVGGRRRFWGWTYRQEGWRGEVGMLAWVVNDGYLSGVSSNPNQRLQLFSCERNFTLIAQYWLLPGAKSSVIWQSNEAFIRGGIINVGTKYLIACHNSCCCYFLFIIILLIYL